MLSGTNKACPTPMIDSLKWALVNLLRQPNGCIEDTLRCQTSKAIMRGYADVNSYNTSLIGVGIDKIKGSDQNPLN